MKQKISAFLHSRYGSDEFSRFLLVVYLVIAVLMLLIRNTALRFVLNGISLAVCMFMFYRMFSGQITKRAEENRKYLRVRQSVKQKILLQHNQWKYRKTHVYRRCPHCRADIRLPRKSGKHTCDCPKCGGTFGVDIK